MHVFDSYKEFIISKTPQCSAIYQFLGNNSFIIIIIKKHVDSNSCIEYLQKYMDLEILVVLICGGNQYNAYYRNNSNVR